MEYNKTNKLRVFTGFSGYDSQCLAIERLKEAYPEFDYELVGWADIEESAIIAHDALFPEAKGKNKGDITAIMWRDVPDFDLFTYSFPCQDISAAGKMAGLKKDSGTRSSMLWECERVIAEKRPRFLLMENVKNLLSKNFKKDYEDWVAILNRYGYTTFTQILDASDFGVPQHRKRVFAVSILRTLDEPKPRYSFPKPQKLELKLKDVLEIGVDEKYFLSDEMLVRFCEKSLQEDGVTGGSNADTIDGDVDFEDLFLQM